MTHNWLCYPTMDTVLYNKYYVTTRYLYYHLHCILLGSTRRHDESAPLPCAAALLHAPSASLARVAVSTCWWRDACTRLHTRRHAHACTYAATHTPAHTPPRTRLHIRTHTPAHMYTHAHMRIYVYTWACCFLAMQNL